MAGYTIKNLQDVDNAAPEGAGDGLEARFARKHLDSEHLGVSYFRYGAGFRAPYGHRHREQEEAYVVVSGSGRMRLDDEVRDLRQWDVVRVAPEVLRAFEAGPDGLDVVAVGGPKPEGGDGVIAESPWPDANA
jgi:quercetin dioxygenase-like cupin family protein